jgi:hypothetical protein
LESIGIIEQQPYRTSGATDSGHGAGQGGVVGGQQKGVASSMAVQLRILAAKSGDPWTASGGTLSGSRLR